MTDWHSIEVTEALSQLDATRQGLSTQQVRERQAHYGPNQLPPPPRRSIWQRWATQFHNILIYVLLAAAIVSALLGHTIDTAVILGVVLINAIIGFIQEGKAERSLDAVRKLLSPRATVLRDGHRVTIDARQLVPGDIVFVQTGDRVPADLRLLTGKDLSIDEALLTGESMPVSKSLAPVAARAQVAGRDNIAWSGTFVARGQGSGLVIATGDATELGHVSKLLAGVEKLTTPLMRHLASFGRLLTAAILIIALLTFAVGILLHGFAAADMFMAAVGLAVAAIPEGLPAIVTITLAIGVQRMARRHAIIRRLPAVETLGSVTVICSDKTGTLTKNEMTVQSLVVPGRQFEISGAGYDPHGGFSENGMEADPDDFPPVLELCLAGALCNDAGVHLRDGQWQAEGDPTEIALAVLALKAGLNLDRLNKQYPRVDVIPFESEHRFMATLNHDHQGHAFLSVKGAPEMLLPRCTREQDGGGSPDLATWEEQVRNIGRQGQRPLAFAYKAMPAGCNTLAFADIERDLELLGLVGIMDPPRPEAIRAVAECHEAGIRVKMITGDHVDTAIAVGKRLGVGDGQQALTGEQLDALDDAGLQQAVNDIDVFARVSPEHKLRLVKALQADGEITAMTGDGVNDAPALKRADVGVAMGGKGTEAAKEASLMVLADDNFASIVNAVEEGRTVYDNIRKSILFILPTSIGEALTVVSAIAVGTDLPVIPVQILWINMLTAVTLGIALAFEPAEAGVMKRPPREPRMPLLTGFMVWRIGFVSLLMLIATFGLFITATRNGMHLETARTLAVNTLVMLEVFYLFNARYLLDPVLNRAGLTGNRWVWITIVLVILLQLVFSYTEPFHLMFHTRDLPPIAWVPVVGAGVLLFVLVEIEKRVLRRLV
ncbi:MAG: cation-transporting P-type ATPase [Gammaproteobacteria bacterium]|nr:cation-transporting P-type ATPase [Gammaproteobacteria bacterium]